jgi:hypothetical protein
VRRLGLSPRALAGACLLAAVLAAALAEAEPSAEALLAAAPSGLRSKLESERVVVLDAASEPHLAGFVVALAIFSRPRRDVVELVSQSARQAEYRPELTSVAVISDGAQERVDEHHLSILFKDVAYRLRYRRDPETDRIEWALDPGFDNDLERLDGFWEFYDLPGERTLGRFGSRVDVGPAFPDFVQQRLSRQTVIRTVENCRQWVDAHGEWRP